MVIRLAILVLAGALAVPASAAAPPEGFRDSTRLGVIASALTGRPVYVRCATSTATWAAMLEPWDLSPEVDALTFPDVEGSYFAPDTCRKLEGWLRGKNAPTPAVLGPNALSLVHEVMHLRGIKTEAAAECAALRALPAALTRWFGIKREVVRQAVMKAAWAEHRGKPAAYRTAC